MSCQIWTGYRSHISSFFLITLSTLIWNSFLRVSWEKFCWRSLGCVTGSSGQKLLFSFWMCFFIHPGILNLPAVALGIIIGGFILKRFKLGVIGAARMSLSTSLGAFCLLVAQVFFRCDVAEVAGLTVTYQGWAGGFCLFFFLNCRPEVESRIFSLGDVHRLLQGSPSVLRPSDAFVAMQHGLFVLGEAVGPCVRLQRDDLRLALPGWLPDLHQLWQRTGKATALQKIQTRVYETRRSNSSKNPKCSNMMVLVLFVK